MIMGSEIFLFDALVHGFVRLITPVASVFVTPPVSDKRLMKRNDNQIYLILVAQELETRVNTNFLLIIEPPLTTTSFDRSAPILQSTCRNLSQDLKTNNQHVDERYYHAELDAKEFPGLRR